MSRIVPDDGPLGARVVVVGEAPGRTEESLGRPFVGSSGQLLSRWMAEVGLQRHDAYWTNVYPFRPPGNDLTKVDPVDLQRWSAALEDRIAALDDPVILALLGNTPLQAILHRSGILKYRGSLYTYTDRRGRVLKVCPTIHPAAVMRTIAWEARCRRDWARIADEAKTPTLSLPQREHFIRPTLDDVRGFVEDVHGATLLAIDIETPREARTVLVEGRAPGCKTCGHMFVRHKEGPCATKKCVCVEFVPSPTKRAKRLLGAPRITCVGFAASPGFSMTIPTTGAYWKNTEQLAEAQTWIDTLCQSATPKALQNGLFDTWWLQHQWGFPVKRWDWDTLAMHHALDPAEEHSLAFMASIDTREPYWKDDRKGDDAWGDPAVDAMDTFWTYNGKDCCVTWELADTYAQRLEAAGLLPFYVQHYQQLFQPLLGMMVEGIAIDRQHQLQRAIDLRTECATLAEKLTAFAGESLIGPKGALSAQRVMKFLYETCQLPKQMRRGSTDRKPTADEVTLRRLRLKYGQRPLRVNGAEVHVGEAIESILLHRRAAKLGTFYAEANADADDRMRCEYTFNTDTGRLSSRKNPAGTGMNLQNVDRAARSMFVADPGHVLLEVDLSQAEWRIVAALTGDPALIQRARMAPWLFDIHRHNAGIIFKKPVTDITKEERYLAKRAVHATSYGMAGTKLSELLLMDDVVRTPEECQGMIDAYMGEHPALAEWQQRTRMQVLQNGCLSTSWGRVLSFPEVAAQRVTDEVFRRAYAFVPQSECADLLNQYGLVPLWRRLQQGDLHARIRLQVHDALVVSAPKEEVWLIYDFLRNALERPRVYAGTPLTIPMDLKVGPSWGQMTEFKHPPTPAEVAAVL